MSTNMLGDSLLPDSVQNLRRSLRSQVSSIREPIRRRREDLVPGPDIIGSVENSVMSLRDRFVTRDGALDRVKNASPMGSDGSGSGSGGSNGNSGQTSGSNGQQSSSQDNSGSASTNV